MSTISQDIRGALATVVNAVSSVPPAAQRAYEGLVFSSTPGVAWMRQTLIPSSGRPFSVSGGQTMHVGLYQVDLFYPTGKGTATVEQVADAIKAALKAGQVPLTLNSTRVIIDYAERGEARPDGADPTFLHLPITVGWRCFSANN